MSKLSDMINIGSKLEEQLKLVGVNTQEELRVTGAKETWLRIKAMDPDACINRLSALEGALQGVRWHYLSGSTKADLKEFYSNNK